MLFAVKVSMSSTIITFKTRNWKKNYRNQALSIVNEGEKNRNLMLFLLSVQQSLLLFNIASNQNILL